MLLISVTEICLQTITKLISNRIFSTTLSLKQISKQLIKLKKKEMEKGLNIKKANEIEKEERLKMSTMGY